jgi:hypothetical protein
VGRAVLESAGLEEIADTKSRVATMYKAIRVVRALTYIGAIPLLVVTAILLGIALLSIAGRNPSESGTYFSVFSLLQVTGFIFALVTIPCGLVWGTLAVIERIRRSN